MRKLAEKGGFIWVILGVMPIATIVNIIGKCVNMDVSIIVTIQIPLLLLQLLSFVLILKYPNETLNL